MDLIPKLLLLVSCMILRQCGDAAEVVWDYKENGPRTEAWCKKAELCCRGNNQSPINLDLKLAKLGVTNAFEFIDYDRFIYLMGINNGHTVQFSQDPTTVGRGSPKPRIRGGGLNATYILHSFHFHWGSDNSIGSEHFDNGFQYPMELHLVHYRSDFQNLGAATASGQRNAIAVIAVFFAVGEVYNNAIEDLTQALKVIDVPESHVGLQRSLRLIDLLPFNIVSLYRYLGSLTTPDCNEVVVWTIFTTPQYLSSIQMNRFRKVTGEDHKRLVNNFRPLQDLGMRDLFRLEARGRGMSDNIVFEEESIGDSNEVRWP